MGKLFLRREIEKLFLKNAHEFIFSFCLRYKCFLTEKEWQQMYAISQTLKEMGNGDE